MVLQFFKSTKVEIHISAQAHDRICTMFDLSTKVEIHISAQASSFCASRLASTKVEIHISAQACKQVRHNAISTKVEIHISAQAVDRFGVLHLIYQSRNSYQCPGTNFMILYETPVGTRNILYVLQSTSSNLS